MKGLFKNSGFSLIELIITIIILGIISAAIYIKWSVTTTILDAQTANLVSDLRYTQNLAIAKNERYRLKIVLPNSYQILDSENNLQVVPPNRGTAITLDQPISFKTITGITNTIIFNGKGVPYKDTAPEEKLDTNVTITLQNSSGQTRTITITKITGRMST